MDSRQIGYRIRNIRSLRNLTQDELVDRYNQNDPPKPLTVSILSTWERGTRVIPAHALLPLALGLSCSVYSLIYDGETKLQNDRMVYEITSLSDRLRSIVKYLFTEWQGDVTKLIECNFMYSQCNPIDRARGAAALLSVYLDAGRPNRKADLPVNTDVIEEARKHLERW